MEACLKEDLPETTELEEYMRNGVHLAKLGNFFASKIVPYRRIFDKELKHFMVKIVKKVLICINNLTLLSIHVKDKGVTMWLAYNRFR